MRRTLLFMVYVLASLTILAQEYFPEGTKWTEIRLDTLKYDSWYSKFGDEWVPNFETIEYYVKGEYTDNNGDKYKCVYTNGPEWTDSLTLLLQEEGDAEYVGHNNVMVSVLTHDYDGSTYPLWPGTAYQFDWSIGKGLYFEDILSSNTTSIERSRFYYGIIDEIKEGYFGGVRPLKYVDLDGKAPADNSNSPIHNVKTKGGRIIQGIGVREWNDGECLFGPTCPYEALSMYESYHPEFYPERHYRSMLVHFECDNEVLYDVWPDKLPPIEINEQNFPDEDFRNWVLNQKYGKDGKLTKEEIAEVTFMNLFPQNIIAEGHIKSLKGIEYFTAVEKLICSRNELTELDLSKNTALTWLECDQNHLTELNLSKNTELTYLDCNSNELTALDMSCCNKLTELNCSMNELITLNVSGCCAMTFLKCYSNQLTLIDMLGCTSLATIWASNNQLSKLNVLDCTSLSTLRCEYNQLIQLDVSNNTELKELRCSDNQLTQLDVSKNKKLTTLRTYNNPIKGEAIDVLIKSLPTVSRGGWCCVLSEDEEGAPTTTQVAVAKAKGWISYYWNEAAKNWMEYAGRETAQYDYRPFVEEGKVWVVKGHDLSADGSPMEPWIEYCYLDGDTIIGGQKCKQMKCIKNDNPSPLYIGAWYEQDKKVYFAGNNIEREDMAVYFAGDRPQFELLYDFTLSSGDNINLWDYMFVVKKISGGITGFKGTYYDIRHNDIVIGRWFEGVGSESRPWNNHPEFLVGGRGVLLACVVGDDVIYYNSEEDDPYSMGARKHRFDFTHTIKTQPKSRMRNGTEVSMYGEYNDQQLSINLDPLNDTYLVSITSESGKPVYEKEINAGNIVGLNIDISNYSEGRYTVTVENSGESFTGEFGTQTTGIEEVRSKRSEVRNNIYNLQGQRLSSLQRGLNIVNGQKVYVK